MSSDLKGTLINDCTTPSRDVTADTKSTSAVETISISDPIRPEDRDYVESGQPEPRRFWVLYAAEGLPEDGLDYRAVYDGPGPSTLREPSKLDAEVVAGHIARALAPQLRRLVRPVVVPPDDAFVDQDAGLFDREVYLRLARKGAFHVTESGKKRVARWGDVKAAFAEKGAPITVSEPTDDPEADLLNEIRQRAGLAIKGGR